MKNAVTAFVLFLLGICLAGYCLVSSSKGDEREQKTRTVKDAGPALLSNVPNEAKDAPEIIHVGDKECRLLVMAWRNNSPDAKPEELAKNLCVSVAIQDMEGNKPDNIIARKLWVINAGKVWQADLALDGVDNPKFFIGNKPGPTWGPGIFTDFIVEFTAPDGQTKRISAQKRNINLTRAAALEDLKFQ